MLRLLHCWPAAVVALGWHVISPIWADSVLPMGSGALLLGQPTVEVEVYTPDDLATPGTNEWVSYGPVLILDVIPHSFLLDTGANSVLIARDPYADSLGESNLDQMKAKGFQDVAGQYREQGVGGFREYNVSGAYHIDAVAPDASVSTLTDAHVLSNDDETLADFSGIIGMPAMMDRVLLLDMTPWLGLDLAYMVNGFVSSVPAATGQRFHVGLTMKPFPQDGQVQVGDPLPVWAPLPFMRVRAVGAHHAAVGDFLMDTGAQLSMVSEHLGLAVGLDTSGDGVLDDQDEAYAGVQQISGVGGVVDVPMFNLEALVAATGEGVDLRWETTLTEVYDEGSGQTVVTHVPLTVLVLEIHPEIDGVVGMDLLHSGWTDAALGGTNAGPIERAFFDFTTATSLTAQLVLDISLVWTSVETRVEEDVDQDGLPDSWELAWFPSTTNASDVAGTDSDGDGFDDGSERIAGTSPVDSNSLLRVLGTVSPNTAGEVVVQWQAVTGLTYHIMSTPGPDPLSAGTTVLTASGVAPMMSATVAVSDASGFLRVVAEPQ